MIFKNAAFTFDNLTNIFPRYITIEETIESP